MLSEAKSDASQLELLNTWLKGYKFEELYSEKDGFGDYLDEIIPEKLELKMGMSKHALGWKCVYNRLFFGHLRF